MNVLHFLPFKTIKTLTLRMDHAKLLDVLTSLPVSRSILPCALCFATSRPANHAICSFIDSSGYASGPIRRCLFIDYIINLGIYKVDWYIRTLIPPIAVNLFNTILHSLLKLIMRPEF